MPRRATGAALNLNPTLPQASLVPKTRVDGSDVSSIRAGHSVEIQLNAEHGEGTQLRKLSRASGVLDCKQSGTCRTVTGSVHDLMSRILSISYLTLECAQCPD